MADTDMNDDIITRIVPQDGWSPIICRMVPITQTITNIVGDKGANEIWQGGSIKNFHAKIDWQDQYSGSRVPADIITESSDNYGETWTMNEVEEHEVGSFELDYEGHERDFEVRINKGEGGDAIYVDGLGTVISSAPLKYFHTLWGLTVAFVVEENDSPTECFLLDDAWFALMSGSVTESRLEMLSSYKGKFLIAISDSLEGKTVYWTELKEGGDAFEPDDYESTGIPVDLNPSGSSVYIRYRWLMNGQEIEDVSGSLEHAITVTDYPVKLEVKAHYADNFGGHEIGAPVKESIVVHYKSGRTDDTLGLTDITKPTPQTGANAVKWADKDGWQSQTWSYTENGRTVTAQVGANITALRDVKIEAELVIPYTAFPPHWGPEDGKDYWCGLKNEDDTDPILIFREGAVVSKSNLLVTMTRNDGSTYVTTDYWMPNNYALGRNKQSVTVQKGSLSTTLPVTVAYSTKVEVGNVSGSTFTKSFFYEYGEYVEPTHYKAYYECYDGTEGFDEVAEIDGEWSSNLHRIEGYLEVYSETNEATCRIYEIKGLQEEWYDSDMKCYTVSTENDNWLYLWDGQYCNYRIPEISVSEDSGIGYYALLVEEESYYDMVNSGASYDGQLYYLDDEGDKGEPLPIPPLSEIPKAVEPLCGEYGSEVGTLTLGSKKYLYRAGLEPIDEENYLFIKDFKDIPFNYGLVKCYEPQWEEPVELIEAKYSDSVTGLYAYPVETPTSLVSSLDIAGITVSGYALLSSAPSTMKGVISSAVLSQVIEDADEGYYLITTTPTIDKNADIKYADGTDVVLKVGGGSDSVVYLGNIEEMNQYYYRLPTPPDNLIQSSGELTIAPLYITTESGVDYGTAVLTTEGFADIFKSYGLSVSEGDWTMTMFSQLDLDHLELAYDQENPFYSKGLDI